MVKDKVPARANGGAKRAEILSDERKKEIAKAAAVARWGAKPVKATHKGSFKQEFGIDVECYVLDDGNKTAVISQRGMNDALGFKNTSGLAFLKFMEGATIAKYAGFELRERLNKPVVFQWSPPGANTVVNGYDVAILIDICQVIIAAETDGKLSARYDSIVKQAHIIIGASAKAGIKGLVYALAGYNPTTQEVIDAFKLYVLEEAKKYEPEFPGELYLEWHRLYNIPVLERGKSWHFKYLTVNHIYTPLANSNGKILELTRAMKAKDGDRKKKLFQFLNDIGARALRMQLGRILEMAQSSNSQQEYEEKITERFGGQRALELVIVPKPSSGNEQPSEPQPSAVPVTETQPEPFRP